MISRMAARAARENRPWTGISVVGAARPSASANGLVPGPSRISRNSSTRMSTPAAAKPATSRTVACSAP